MDIIVEHCVKTMLQEAFRVVVMLERVREAEKKDTEFWRVLEDWWARGEGLLETSGLPEGEG